MEGSYSDGEQSAPSSATSTQQAYLWPDKMTESWRPSRFGVTFAPLTAHCGEAVLMSYLAAFPVKTLAEREGWQASAELNQGYGWNLHGSFARLRHDGCSWKTRQILLTGDLALYSETWPAWGIMLDGECLEQTPVEVRTLGSACGWWPTLVADDAARHRKGKYAQGGTSLTMAVGGKLSPTWCEWLMGWPVGWTAFDALGMGRFRQWLRLHGEC